jgi:hypothetical protein
MVLEKYGDMRCRLFIVHGGPDGCGAQRWLAVIGSYRLVFGKPLGKSRNVLSRVGLKGAGFGEVEEDVEIGRMGAKPVTRGVWEHPEEDFIAMREELKARLLAILL